MWTGSKQPRRSMAAEQCLHGHPLWSSKALQSMSCYCSCTRRCLRSACSEKLYVMTNSSCRRCCCACATGLCILLYTAHHTSSTRQLCSTPIIYVGKHWHCYASSTHLGCRYVQLSTDSKLVIGMTRASGASGRAYSLDSALFIPIGFPSMMIVAPYSWHSLHVYSSL